MIASKYCLVTGASGDIGEACARQLAAAGYSVYCHYRQHEEKVRHLIEDLTITYPQQDFFPVHGDFSQDSVLETFNESIFQLDGIIFAHGGTIYDLLTEHSSTDFDTMWQTHLKRPIQFCQNFQSKLSSQQNGRIIFISSVYGLIGSSMEVLYSTLKGGQLAFTNAYAKEVASLGITVNAIAPGAVDTHMNQDWTKEETEELLESIPLNRMARPDEIASLALFLMSDNARYITGTTLPITGGWKI